MRAAKNVFLAAALAITACASQPPASKPSAPVPSMVPVQLLIDFQEKQYITKQESDAVDRLRAHVVESRLFADVDGRVIHSPHIVKLSLSIERPMGVVEVAKVVIHAFTLLLLPMPYPLEYGITASVFYRGKKVEERAYEVNRDFYMTLWNVGQMNDAGVDAVFDKMQQDFVANPPVPRPLPNEPNAAPMPDLET